MHMNYTQSMGGIYLPIAGLWPAVLPSRWAIAHGPATVCNVGPTNVESHEVCWSAQEMLIPKHLCQMMASIRTSMLHFVWCNWDRAQDVCMTLIRSGQAKRWDRKNGNLESVLLAITARHQVLKVALLYSLPLPVHVSRRDFPSAPRECVIASSVIIVIGKQQEKRGTIHVWKISSSSVLIGPFGTTVPLCTQCNPLWMFASAWKPSTSLSYSLCDPAQNVTEAVNIADDSALLQLHMYVPPVLS
ncbi:hypothetical protein EDB85DRAFT_1891769 [Lactarius pseudohatsudake]|nr:hypothetical protein EDB85DRAFT_1891769 [Lactarius pseudohatsudake]